MSELVASLQAAGLMPQPLIPAGFTPSTSLAVAFGEKSVHLGNFFRASECKVAPSIGFEEETPGSTYTLLLIDPDAPTPDDPKFAFWRHWVVSGLKAGAQALPSESASTLTEYLGPGPKDESGPHRYLFLLFREPPGLALTKADVGGEEFTQRRSFQAAEWVSQHGLELVGVSWMRGVGDGWKE